VSEITDTELLDVGGTAPTARPSTPPPQPAAMDTPSPPATNPNSPCSPSTWVSPYPYKAPPSLPPSGASTSATARQASGWCGTEQGKAKRMRTDSVPPAAIELALSQPPPSPPSPPPSPVPEPSSVPPSESIYRRPISPAGDSTIFANADSAMQMANTWDELAASHRVAQLQDLTREQRARLHTLYITHENRLLVQASKAEPETEMLGMQNRLSPTDIEHHQLQIPSAAMETLRSALQPEQLPLRLGSLRSTTSDAQYDRLREYSQQLARDMRTDVGSSVVRRTVHYMGVLITH
jgi:hypothetical protein